MSRQAIKLDRTYAFPSRFIQLCSQEQKTLDDWGNTFGVTRQTITNWQLGESAPNVIALAKIAEHFGVSTDYLLGLSDTRNPDVSARAAVAYTGLSEKAVEQLHIGLDDFACDGVGISDYDKAVNLRIASELICSEEFSQMIYRLRLMEEASYDEGILRILEAEYSEDALTDTDEFVFATPEDRAVTIKAIEHIPTDFFTLVEIIYNFWYIANRAARVSIYGFDEEQRKFFILRRIMDNCLSHYGYKGEYFPDLEQLIVIEDKPEATAVAEIVPNEISLKVLRYNHFSLKGDLQAKKEILLALGEQLEPKRKQLSCIASDLADNIFFMLNNLHLRHNNKVYGDKNYRKVVADMDDSTLEHWYDELYQMILLAFLQLDQVDRNAKILELKQTISSK